MERKTIFQFVFLFLISFVLNSSNGSKIEIVWNNFQNFTDGGWSAISTDEYGTGFGFDKPSDIIPELAPLDETVTGNGIWSGLQSAEGFNFINFLNSTDELDGITEANLTIKAYWGKVSMIGVYPCLCERGPYCACMFDGSESMEWKTKEVPINVTQALEVGLEIYSSLTTLPGRGRVLLLDEVRLSYESLAKQC